MGIGNILVLSQVIAFLLSFICAFFICAPLAVNQRSFDGHCLLYGSGEWRNATGQQFLYVDWGPSSACGFVIFMGIVTILLSLFYIVLESVYLFKNTDSSWLEAFITTLISLVMALMHFAAALTLAIGFERWCDLITHPGGIAGVDSCEIADYTEIPTENGSINTTNFYTEMKMGEFGEWMCFLCWFYLAITSVVKVVRFQQHESFMSSVGRERQRLLQKVGHRTDYTV